MKRVGDLEIEEDIAYQRRFHVFQRVSWIVMALVLIAAFTGILGPGLTGPRSITSADSALEATYERTTNYQKDSMMSITVSDAAPGSVSIWMNRDLLDNIHIKQIIPEPERVMAAPGRVYFEFIQSQAGELEISFYFQPMKTGRLQAQAGHSDSELAFDQFIFP